MNLFSNYFGTTSVKSQSANEQVVSAYSALTANEDTLTVVLINRDRINSRTVQLNIQDFTFSTSNVKMFRLSNLPNNETFISKNSNALQKTDITLANTLSLPKLSVTLLRIPKGEVTAIEKTEVFSSKVFPNPSHDRFKVELDKPGKYTIKLMDNKGKLITSWKSDKDFSIDLNSYAKGLYFLHIEGKNYSITKKIIRE